ncbi:MAG: T9SS type A sorting domain-containing protein [Bacteroidota bacterium]
MKKLYSLLGGLLLAGAALQAQTSAVALPQIPCSTFEDPNPAGNWFTTASSASYTGLNPLDGSQCVILSDQSGASYFSNNIDYNNLGQRYPNQCLCFDYFLQDDGDPGTISFNPTVYLTDGVNTIAFVSSTAVTEGSGWIHVCAPIEHCTGTTLPGNTDGNWILITGSTCTDFNAVLDNVTSIYFPTDITSCPCEKMSIDNVCVQNCGGCNADFKLSVTFNPDGTATADVFLISTDPSATYVVDWGDGSPSSTPYVSHVYSTGGTYVVCITEYLKKEVICKRCMTFCFRKPDGSDGPVSRVSNATVSPVLIRTLTDNKFSDEGFAIYPNPSKDLATVKMNLSEKNKVSVKVIDLLGKIVAETTGNYESGTQEIKLNTEKLPTGIYNVEIMVGNKVSTQKLSISK